MFWNCYFKCVLYLLSWHWLDALVISKRNTTYRLWLTLPTPNPKEVMSKSMYVIEMWFFCVNCFNRFNFITRWQQAHQFRWDPNKMKKVQLLLIYTNQQLQKPNESTHLNWKNSNRLLPMMKYMTQMVNFSAIVVEVNPSKLSIFWFSWLFS